MLLFIQEYEKEKNSRKENFNIIENHLENTFDNDLINVMESIFNNL